MWIRLTNTHLKFLGTWLVLRINILRLIATWKEKCPCRSSSLLIRSASSFVKFSALWSATSKITFCISKFILKNFFNSIFFFFFSKMDLNILQSVRPTGSFSALCIVCELYRCTATRLSLVTSEPLQLSMHSHQGIDTDITQDQRADCDRKVIKGQNLYTPLRKGEQGHKWLTWESDVPSRPSHSRCSLMILLPPSDIFISCTVASQRRSLLLSLVGDILGHVATTKSLFGCSIRSALFLTIQAIITFSCSCL